MIHFSPTKGRQIPHAEREGYRRPHAPREASMQIPHAEREAYRRPHAPREASMMCHPRMEGRFLTQSMRSTVGLTLRVRLQ